MTPISYTNPLQVASMSRNCVMTNAQAVAPLLLAPAGLLATNRPVVPARAGVSTSALPRKAVVAPQTQVVPQTLPPLERRAYSLPQVPSTTRNEFGTLLAIKALVGVLEAGVNSRLHGSKFKDALAGEVLATLLTSVATTALDTTIGDQLPSKRAKDQSLALINAGVTMMGAVGLTLWNKHAAPDSAVKGVWGWSKALGMNLAIGLTEGVLADRWLKRKDSTQST